MAQKLYLSQLLMLMTAFASTHYVTDSRIEQLKGGNIGPGMGYSSDSTQIAPQICFNTKIASVSDASS